MISARMDGSAFQELQAELDAWPNVPFNLDNLRQPLTEAIQKANRETRLAGENWIQDGTYLTELAASTLKKRHGDPTPFVEHGTASRVIRNLVVIIEGGRRKLNIRLTWPGCEWLVYHKQGGGRLPVRDVVGISGRRMVAVDNMIVQECDRQAAEWIKRNPGRTP